MIYPQPNRKVLVISRGLIDYQEAWNYQEQLFSSITEIKLQNRSLTEAEPTPNYLIVCEHPPVFTLGKSGSTDHLLVNTDELENMGAGFYKINRGGDITHHGPGQMVAYPVIDLENFFTDIHKYLRLLEECIIELLSLYGIEAGRLDGYTGVWIEPEHPVNARKICAMGVKCGRWVTMHGLALNVNNDLSWFNHIVPCGISDRAVTSMQKELPSIPIDIKKVEKEFLEIFAKQFDAQLEPMY